MRRLKLFARSRLQETQLLFKAVAGAAERGWAGCKRWRGAVSGVLNPACRQCAFFACCAHQNFANTEQKRSWT